MLTLTIPSGEYWDSSNEEFFDIKKDVVLQLEHSLVSISKWESKFEKPFLNAKDFTYAELLYYVKCMTISQNVNNEIYRALTQRHILQIKDYMNSSMTATTFSKHTNEQNAGRPSKQIITSELIYYWMFSLQIPKECEKWHLNRLLTLIRVFDEKQKEQEAKSKGKHQNPKSAAAHHASLNAARRKH